MEKQALVGNAADENQVKAAGRKERFNRDTELKDLRMVLSTVEGRRHLWRYLGVCGIDRSSFGQGNKSMNFLEGQRNIGLMLKADIIAASVDLYFLMIKEAKEGIYGN